ncbi:DEAD/DEAH box helicase [Stenotrophomonas maltophilia]|uniref:DEAD/DEAH box helicase n=1 Tax=Stenotrophomonas maltophilia TaxID=40324 RepID=UPI0009BD6C7E|nr:DEAD/DEAH box helicase [Stenotrophomonas maltophilia]
MAFKKMGTTTSIEISPESLILDLPRRKIPGLLAHQSETLRSYGLVASEKRDVALQLPTGSGKTLVGALIGEWRRRTKGERVVYLAPTKQLVNQVASLCENRYGIQVSAFTGSANNYTIEQKTNYRTGDRLAITTYSSLFNTNPFFKDADTIIIDDAHASENYVASMWSLSIRNDVAHQSIAFQAIISSLAPHLDAATRHRLSSSRDTNAGWVDKLPTPALMTVENELRAVLETYASDAGVWFPWSLIRDNLTACHVYFNESEILIRPFIPPTWTHPAFTTPRHRVYMSATLGAGGDLERLFGRPSIFRLPPPPGWDRQGVGRRLFLLPGLSLDKNESESLRNSLVKQVPRSLVLVTNDSSAKQISEDINESTKLKTITAKEIELSKAPFIETAGTVAVIANRYDGIDFPGDDCRLMFVDGLPTGTDLQEKFLISRLGANTLFRERIQTRVLQAMGRCTRSLEDYSAVIVGGDDLQDYLTDRRNREHFHPEIQAELEFGIAQSKSASYDDFEQYLSVFLKNDEEWEIANADIISARDRLKETPSPATQELGEAVSSEISYQMAAWQGDFAGALDSATTVLSNTKHPDLRGYRALWNYLAGSAAHLAHARGQLSSSDREKAHFAAAKNAAIGLRWLIDLGTQKTGGVSDSNLETSSIEQIEAVQRRIMELGLSQDRRYASKEREIRVGLSENASFEAAQVSLGILLGLDARKIESDGSPDPWWLLGNECIVFEDHAGALEENLLSIDKARQAAGHEKWMRSNVTGLETVRITTVLVTPVKAAPTGARPHLEGIFLWPLHEFREWAELALTALREIRKNLAGNSDILWRPDAISVLRREGVDFQSLLQMVRQRPAADNLEFR